MAVGYKRKSSLFIGRAEELVDKVTQPNVEVKQGQTSSKNTSPSEDFNTEPDNLKGIRITENQIQANIKANKGNANIAPATIEVFNLSRENRARIRVKDTVLLKGGYDSQKNLPLVFAGQISNVYSEKRGSDVVTTLVCDGSFVPRRWIRFSKTYPKGSTTASILLDLTGIARGNGVGLSNLSVPRENDKTYPNGFSAEGNLFDVIKTVCTDNGLSCYMVLGKFVIEGKDVQTKTNKINVRSENIITIKEEQDSSISSISEEKPDVGLKITTFLNGNIKLDTLANITTKEYEGTYEITSVNHILDYRGQKWWTTFSCRRL